MTNKEYNDLVESLHKKRIAVREKKTKDYATDDVLSNFKRISKAAKFLNIKPHSADGYAMFMILMKLDRINNLIGRSPENEPIEDSIIDLHNYTDLLLAILNEEEFIINETPKDEKNNKKILQKDLRKYQTIWPVEFNDYFDGTGL